MDKILYVNRDT